jgi:hypothetical protein
MKKQVPKYIADEIDYKIGSAFQGHLESYHKVTEPEWPVEPRKSKVLPVVLVTLMLVAGVALVLWAVQPLRSNQAQVQAFHTSVPGPKVYATPGSEEPSNVGTLVVPNDSVSISTLSLRAKSSCWVRLVVDSTTEFEGNVPKGWERMVSFASQASVRTGCPGWIDYDLDGKPQPVINQAIDKTKVELVTFTRELR